MSNDQDWKPVVITNPRIEKSTAIRKGYVAPEKKAGAGGNRQSVTGGGLNKIDAGTVTLPKITHELATAIRAGREAKSWKQSDLATRAGIPVSELVKLENPNSGIVINKTYETYLTKLGRALGVPLKKPKAKKNVEESDMKDERKA